MAELWLLISAPPIGPRSNSSISPTPCPLKMCDLDSIPLAEHYWHPAYKSAVLWWCRPGANSVRHEGCSVAVILLRHIII
jgi:hypothetical protein